MRIKGNHVILVAGAAMMLCVGILYLWSVFQPHVVAHYGWSPAQVSMTSSAMITCFVLGNILAGLVQEKIHPRIIAVSGSVLFTLGLYLSALISPDRPFMLYLSYGVMGGIGSGLVYCVVLAVLQKWYAAKMGFITGISVGFFGLSVVVLSPVVEAMINSLGLIMAFKVLAIAFFVILLPASAVLTNPAKEYYYAEASKSINPENIKQFTPSSMLRSPSYYYIVISMFASSAAYMVIVPYISTIAVARGMSSSLALVAVMGTGMANAAGRLLAPIISDKIGRTTTIILCALISACACLLIIRATGSLYILAVFLIALSYGGTGGTNPVITTELFGARYSGANYGFVLLSIAFSSIVFGRLSGSLGSGGDFMEMFIICAIICIVPCGMMMLLKRRCKRLGKKI